MEADKKLVKVRIFGQDYSIRASTNEDYIKYKKNTPILLPKKPISN